MELLEPEQRVAHQERPHLVAPVVEDQRSPVLVLALPRVGMLVERRAVELRQPVLILRKMARHPVEDHADAMAMALIDEVAEIIRRAEPAGRREEADDLVAPRSGERMLHHRHQLDVRVAHLADVRHQRLRQLAVGQIAIPLLGHSPPRAEVHLVDRHRPLVPAAERRPIAQPLAVAPLVAPVGPDHRRAVRRHLEPLRVRIRLLQQMPGDRPHLVLVAGAFRQTRE